MYVDSSSPEFDLVSTEKNICDYWVLDQCSKTAARKLNNEMKYNSNEIKLTNEMNDFVVINIDEFKIINLLDILGHITERWPAGSF